jgi:hypothetical protein
MTRDIVKSALGGLVLLLTWAGLALTIWVWAW